MLRTTMIQTRRTEDEWRCAYIKMHRRAQKAEGCLERYRKLAEIVENGNVPFTSKGYINIYHRKMQQLKQRLKEAWGVYTILLKQYDNLLCIAEQCNDPGGPCKEVAEDQWKDLQSDP